MLTLADKILIAVLATLTLFSYSIGSSGKQGTEVRIEVEGKTVGIYSLKKDGVHKISGALGESIVSIKDEKVSFASSPCKNKVCIHQGSIGKSGQMAACLPNKVVARVVGGNGDYDAITR